MSNINGITTVEYFDVNNIKEEYSLNQLQNRVSSGGLSSLLPRAQDSPIYIGIFISIILIALICVNTQGLNSGVITCFTGKIIDTINHITTSLIQEPKK